MNDEITLAVVIERISNLKAAIDEGFKGVHARQDKTNGNVKKNTEWRLRNSRPMTMLSSVITIIITSVVVAGITLVIK